MMNDIGPHIPGRGNRSASIMLVGEAGGYKEEELRKCWVGKAGKELARYLRQAGIDIRDCWLTNLLKHRPTTRSKSGNVKPTAADIRRDEWELIDELETIRPTFVGAVGAVASKWLLGRDVFDSLESMHAFPYQTKNRRAGDAGHEFVTVPLYHPASGLHSPEQQPVVFFDFLTFGKYVAGKLPLVTPHDTHPDPDYYEPRASVRLVPNLPIAIDTEGLLEAGRGVWGLSFTQFAGSAGVVRATNKRALRSMKEQLFR